jgi:K+/H+ antiporter YhaU regulatory subunit KhtT
MAVALTKPAVGDFIDSATANQLELGFEQLEVDHASPLCGRKLRDTTIRSELNVVIVSIRRMDGQRIFNPSGDFEIQAGDLLVAIGDGGALLKLQKLTRANISKGTMIEV